MSEDKAQAREPRGLVRIGEEVACPKMMIACQACGREFYGKRSDARTCGDSCRQRLRRSRQRGNRTRSEARTADLSVTMYSGNAPVHTPARVTDKSVRVADRPTRRRLPPGVVPDAKWPGMYRLRLPDGSLTDMVNLTRANEADRLAAISFNAGLVGGAKSGVGGGA
jgi:hypothetical protein